MSTGIIRASVFSGGGGDSAAVRRRAKARARLQQSYSLRFSVFSFAYYFARHFFGPASSVFAYLEQMASGRGYGNCLRRCHDRSPVAVWKFPDVPRIEELVFRLR